MPTRSALTGSLAVLAAATVVAAAAASANPTTAGGGKAGAAAPPTGAIYASPLGDDSNPGTRTLPKREIQAAVYAASAAGKDVYAAAGTYQRVQVQSGVD